MITQSEFSNLSMAFLANPIVVPKKTNDNFWGSKSLNLFKSADKMNFMKEKSPNYSLKMLNLNNLDTIPPFSRIPFPDCSIVIDAGKLNIKREDVINEKFLFSDSTTSVTEVEKEIEEIEDDEYRYSAWRNSQVFLALGGSALGMWFAYKGLTALEKWMKEQEQKDIEEEIQMTGTYINPGAEKVEASIDPKTGKRIQIKNDKNEEKKEDEK